MFSSRLIRRLPQVISLLTTHPFRDGAPPLPLRNRNACEIWALMCVFFCVYCIQAGSSSPPQIREESKIAPFFRDETLKRLAHNNLVCSYEPLPTRCNGWVSFFFFARIFQFFVCFGEILGLLPSQFFGDDESKTNKKKKTWLVRQGHTKDACKTRAKV